MEVSTALQILSCFFAFAAVYRLAVLVQDRVSSLMRPAKDLELAEVLQDRVLCFTILAACGLVASAASSWWALVPCLAFAAVASGRAPQLLERREHEQRRRAIDAELDVLSDTISMGVKSGLSFDAALELYCARFSGPLAQELEKARLVWENGLASRRRALQDMSRRVGSKELTRFCGTVLQALERGAPLSAVLDAFSEDLRDERQAQLEERVEKVPVKMLVPTGTCILPAMLILVMGPALVQFLQNGT